MAKTYGEPQGRDYDQSCGMPRFCKDLSEEALKT